MKYVTAKQIYTGHVSKLSEGPEHTKKKNSYKLRVNREQKDALYKKDKLNK